MILHWNKNITYKQKCMHVNNIEIPPCTNTATHSFTELALGSNICLSLSICHSQHTGTKLSRQNCFPKWFSGIYFHLSPSAVHFICIKLTCENLTQLNSNFIYKALSTRLEPKCCKEKKGTLCQCNREKRFTLNKYSKELIIYWEKCL